MAINTEFLIDYNNRIISHSTATTIYSVQQLYSYLQNTFDEQGQMVDTIPMSPQTPSEFTLINGWFIPDKSTQFLASGSIQTSGHSGSVLVCVASEDTPFLHSDLGMEISGSTSGDVGTLLDFQTDNFGLFKLYIRPSASADVFTTAEELVVSGGTGTATQAVLSLTGESIFTNLYGLGGLVDDTNLYVLQSGSIIGDPGATAPSWWGSQFFDVLIKVKEAGQVFDDSNLRIYAHEYGSLYDHFTIRAPIGRNAVPLGTSTDAFNTTDAGLISPYSTSIAITLYSSSQNFDLDNGNGAQPYNCVINCSTASLADVYEYTKYLTDRLYFGDLDDGTNYDPVTGSIYTIASESFAANKQAPFGSYTGKFFAARGVWLTNLNPADVKNFSLIDSLGVIQDPPNTVAVSVTAVSGSDNITVFRLTGGGGSINKSEYYTSESVSLGSNYIIVSGSITTDTPKISTIRLTDSGNIYKFTSWVNDGTPVSGTFFLSASVTTTIDYEPNSASYVPLIDIQADSPVVSNTLVQSSIIPVLIRVRNGTPDYGILPFEIESEIGPNGLSIAATRTIDPINTSG